jgi:cyclopropane fatty-acyl-phospholipid synthase-like methyltransferase
MDWKKYWDAMAQSKDALVQVGRVNSRNDSVIALSGERIMMLLGMQAGDRVLDLCCGNGLLTKYIAEKGFDITGVDLSEQLLEEARRSGPGIRFIAQDVSKLSLNEKFDKIYLAFSFQYFDTFEKGRKALEAMVAHTHPGGCIVLTDVPDQARWSIFYDTFIKKLFYYKQKLTGKVRMGKFWSEKELGTICNSLGVKGEVVTQPSGMPYSRYRFDYVIHF